SANRLRLPATAATPRRASAMSRQQRDGAVDAVAEGVVEGDAADLPAPLASLPGEMPARGPAACRLGPYQRAAERRVAAAGMRQRVEALGRRRGEPGIGEAAGVEQRRLRQ